MVDGKENYKFDQGVKGFNCALHVLFCLSLSILAEDSLAASSFEAIASSLHQRFNKNEHFQIGSAMVCAAQ